jgi:hypothetical protein
MVEVSQFPLGMEYLAADPLAGTYLELAERLRVVYADTASDSDEQLAGIKEVIASARAAEIPEGRLSYISGLAIGLNRRDGQQRNEGN